MDATVVVPTRNRPDSLRRTLRALAAQRTDRSWELVVVDDGSDPPAPPSPPNAPGYRQPMALGLTPWQELPLVWARRHGRGRVFYDALGHLTETWRDHHHFRRVLRRGLAWALGY